MKYKQGFEKQMIHTFRCKQVCLLLQTVYFSEKPEATQTVMLYSSLKSWHRFAALLFSVWCLFLGLSIHATCEIASQCNK